MEPESPRTSRETGDAEDGGTSDASHPPGLVKTAEHRPLRLLDLMVLIAAVALTFVLPPPLMNLIQKPLSGWGWREQFAYKVSLVLTFWTPILALIVVIGNRSRIRCASRSYGTSAVMAAASATLLLSLRGLNEVALSAWRGQAVFPWSESYYSPVVLGLVRDMPAAAAAAIAAVWLSLALTGAGRRPSGWFDRCCLLFGLLWVLHYLGRDYILRAPWLW